MNRTKILVFGGLLLMLAMAALIFWQQQTLRREQMENSRLRAQAAELEAALKENAPAPPPQLDLVEQERGRKALAELARLRGEFAKLRQQLDEARRAAAATGASAKATPPAPAEPPIAPVETYTATVRATLATRQTLVTGGWITREGRRSLVFVEPEFGGSADLNGQVLLRTRIVEMPDSAFASLGLDALKSEGKQSSGQAILTPEQAAALVKTLEGTAGVDILSAPMITTADGRQAQVKVADVRTAPSGEAFETGPMIDIVPHLSADRASVDLNITAQLRLAAPAR